MQPLDLQNFKTINTIIERDSKDTTYKYALLRGAVEISQEYQHMKRENCGRVDFPLGLLVEKWLLYYYPFIENDIPQKPRECEKGAKQISFRRSFREITDYYSSHGKFSEFYKDYSKGSIPPPLVPVFRKLVKEIRTTITQYPMKHLGYSATKRHYSVFDYDRNVVVPSEKFSVDRDTLIRQFGTYSLSREYDQIFEVLGSFIAGEDAVLFQWAEFTRAASDGNVSLAGALEKLRTFPITERDVEPARSFYEQLLAEAGVLDCTWSGRPIMSRESLHIDHLLPFSVFRNNDLWNLLPSTNRVNLDKKDKIPSLACIESCRPAILRYWGLLREAYPERFDREISLSLTGSAISGSSCWEEVAIRCLKEKCRYLIEVRGCEEWKGI